MTRSKVERGSLLLLLLLLCGVSSAASCGAPCSTRVARIPISVLAREPCEERANGRSLSLARSLTCGRRGTATPGGECAAVASAVIGRRRRVVQTPSSRERSASNRVQRERYQCVETQCAGVDVERRSLVVIGCYGRAALVSRGTIMIYFRPHDGRSLRCNANARHLNVLVVPLFPLWIIGAFCVKDSKCAYVDNVCRLYIVCVHFCARAPARALFHSVPRYFCPSVRSSSTGGHRRRLSLSRTACMCGRRYIASKGGFYPR